MFNLILLFVSTKLFAMDSNFKYEYNSFKNAAIESNTLSPKQIKLLKTINIRPAKKNELNGYFIGMCLSKENTIIINLDAFINAPLLYRQEVIDHEMGHCILQRSHYNATTSIGFQEFPDSTMHFITNAYNSDNDMLIKRKELFTKHFYGTIEAINNADQSMPSYALRQLEHKVMAERIESYKKSN